MKGRLVQSNAERVRRIESGDLPVVGVNCFTETEPSPLASLDAEHSIVVVDPAAEREQVEHLAAWRAARDDAAATRALDALRAVAATDENIVPVSVELARAGGTVGEWAGALREVFGEYRAPDRRRRRGRPGGRPRRGARPRASGDEGARRAAASPRRQARARRALERGRADRGRSARRRHGGRLPGHPAHARADRGRGARRGRRRGGPVDPVGVTPRARARDAAAAARGRRGRARRRRRDHPRRGPPKLTAAGVARVYTPKDYRLTTIVGEIADLAIDHREHVANSA